VHANARLTLWGRSELVARIAAGQSVAMVAEEMNVSRATAYKWWRRWEAEGEAGLLDRSSRPHRCPHRTSVALERRIISLRQRRKLGPARIAPIVGVPPSTVHRVLTRHGLHRLAWMDRPTGRLIRRIETSRPGELVHTDTKRLARIPPGGGWRAHGRGNTADHHSRTRVGYDLIHTVIDAHTRVAYVEVHDNETGPTCAAVFERAIRWFAGIGVRIEVVLSDNARQYQRHFDAVCEAHNIEHRRIRPYRPQTNGKVERFNRTMLDEWAYVRPYRSDTHRLTHLARWLHNYNHHRCHTALDGDTPISRVDNGAGQYS
jgi:transposase InsO family protein